MYNGKMETIYESEYMNLYDLQYREGGHYYCASRRKKDRMVALTPDEECKTMQADAVSCFVVLNIKGQPKKLLLNWEYRYPVGQYMLSVPAGLIDEKDWDNPNALTATAIRELKEETGIEVEESDEIKEQYKEIPNPLVVFVKDRTPSINGDNFSADELYMEYVSWAETGHNKIMTRSNFRQKIQPIIEEYYPTYERYRSSKRRLNWRDTRTK